MTDVDHFERRRGALEQWIAGAIPEASSVTLSPFVAAASGFSNVTLFTDLAWSDARGEHNRELVLRAQPPQGGLFPDYDLRLQYDVMKCLRHSEIPVPAVAWFIDDLDVFGAPCFLMQRVHGEVASGFRPGFHGHGLFFDASIPSRRQMWFAAIDTMATLHGLDLATLRLPDSMQPTLTAAESVSIVLRRIEHYLDVARADVPVLRQALETLKSRVPGDLRTALCWGDARPGNIVYRDDKVVSVLDWELAHIGPPEGDLAYLLLADDVVAELNDVPRLRGLPEASETIARYQDATSRPVQNLDFHSILQALRMASMLVLTVRLSPPELTFPPDYLSNNVPTRRLAGLLRAYG
ncbi:MAG TPA: phosphotransferase family protein [Mycobacterium sp.]|jgi:aminoglycoside phosphotransferase (APT) family kinase protein|nr:phosphotransferase family protein [Mycobacterium sp.]